MTPTTAAAIAVLMLIGAYWLQRTDRALTFACGLAFMTALAPKAGIKLGDFPIPFFLFGIMIAVGVLALISPRRSHPAPVIITLFLLITWSLVRSVVLLPSAQVSGVAAYLAWSVLPAVLLYISTQIDRTDRRFNNAMERGFIGAAAFAVVQQLFGIRETAIPGLTIAFGDSYDTKHNVIFTSTGEDFSKIPSTYQNGNIFGVAAAVFLVIAASRVIDRTANRQDLVLLLGGAIGVALSGSRTAVVLVVAAAVILALKGGSFVRKLAIGGALAGAYALVATMLPGLVERYSLANLAASGGGGRVGIWDYALSTMNAADFVVGTGTYRTAEGWVGMIQQHGIIGIGLLVAFVVSVTWYRRDWRMIYGLLFLVALLDSSYLLFPTWFLPAAMAVASRARPRPVDDAEPEMQPSAVRLRRARQHPVEVPQGSTRP